MLPIHRDEVDYLRKNGLGNAVTTVNKTHKGKRKTYYVDETEEAMAVLKEYKDNLTVTIYNK